jgi:dienelactone hydrolase
MGGMYCFKSAGLACFDRIASFYGMIHTPEQWASPDQGDPLEYVRNGDASKVLAIIGSLDTWTPPGHVQELRDAGVTVVEYSRAEHGFAHDTSRPAHRPDDATDAFARARAWLT